MYFGDRRRSLYKTVSLAIERPAYYIIYKRYYPLKTISWKEN
jgi:hypothetical protein